MSRFPYDRRLALRHGSARFPSLSSDLQTQVPTELQLGDEAAEVAWGTAFARLGQIYLLCIDAVLVVGAIAWVCMHETSVISLAAYRTASTSCDAVCLESTIQNHSSSWQRFGIDRCYRIILLLANRC